MIDTAVQLKGIPNAEGDLAGAIVAQWLRYWREHSPHLKKSAD